MKKASKKLPKAKDGIFRKREWTNTVAPDDSVVSTRTNRRGAKITVVTDDKGKRVSRTKETPAQQRYNERFGEEIKALGYKTGGVVNSNKKVKAIKVAGSKGGAKKPLRKAQDGKVVRTRDENVSATMYPSINPASNAQNKSNVNREFNYPGEYTERYSSGPTTTKKGLFGRTIQKTTSTDTTIPESGPAFGWTTTDKDVFNKKGQLVKSVRKERDINTGKLERVNRAKFDKTWTGKKGGAVKKMKTGGMVNSNTKVTALKSAGSKGVKSGVNPKASASKRATGRSGGTSTAPKTAVPKAKYGMVMRGK